MLILTNKDTNKIIESVSIADIVENKWIKSSGGSLIQLDMINVIEVESVPQSAKYYSKNKFYDSDPIQIEKNNQETIKQLKALDNPRDAEDLFTILKAKGILTDSDLPEATLNRFNAKSELRNRLK